MRPLLSFYRTELQVLFFALLVAAPARAQDITVGGLKISMPWVRATASHGARSD
jgi:hypothetical protein